MLYILNWSGGKDSTASVILAHENNEPLDEIVFCEVMFDKTNRISGENPRHIKFINETARPIFESWGYKVVIICSDKDYLDFFNHVIERPRLHPDHKGKRYGFPGVGMCGIQRDLKIKPLDTYVRNKSTPVIQYVGICANENRRLLRLKGSNKLSLLEKYGYTEEMARAKCEEYGLLSPCYELSKRGGCWFCPNAKMAEYREIKMLYPNAWKRFVDLEGQDVAYAKFNPFSPSLHQIDAQLEECRQSKAINNKKSIASMIMHLIRKNDVSKKKVKEKKNGGIGWNHHNKKRRI